MFALAKARLSHFNPSCKSIITLERHVMLDRIAYKGITFDDVLLEPAYSEIVPREAATRTKLTRNITLGIPIVSAPMDTVTESELAIALAQEGGIGIIHKNIPIEAQAREVYKVKRSESGIIVDPITLRPADSVEKAREVMQQHKISGVPITDDNGRLHGILTRRDLRFLESNQMRLEEVMTKENLVTASESTSLEEAERILTKNKVEKLLLVDEENRLKGLITIKDIDKLQRYPGACKDSRGRLRVGAAVGVFDYERIEALLAADVDVLVVDSAHGHSANVVRTVAEIKRRFKVDLIAGNVATYEGARDLIDAGADAIKTDIPVVSDGGIRYSGDITKAIAAGAHAVMIGGLFAGLAESPGKMIIYKGRSFKTYRGMGSIGAMVEGTSAERYGQKQSKPNKLVPEGVEGRVPYKGPLAEYVYQLVGGLKAGMGYCGAANIEELRTRTRFIQVTSAAIVESHPHDISITQESPNYSYSAELVDMDGG
jgi:IMP dehydrogenase